MRELIRRQRKQPGLSPGTLIHVGEQKAQTVDISFHQYNNAEVIEQKSVPIKNIPHSEDKHITWIQVSGIHDVEKIDTIGKQYSLHPLLLEDILNTEQRPKVEDYTDYLFIVFKTLDFDEETHGIRSDQIALVIGKNLLISFHENETGFFNPIRERIQSGKGRIRKMGSDYLAYALMDVVIDHYFITLEKLGSRIDDIEKSLLNNPSVEVLHNINFIKREMVFLRKNIWPVRELVATLERRESPIIHQHTVIYLRDLYDHIVQAIDTIESMRDVLTGMLDVYLSSMSNKTNEVIKVLTIIATIFIPLTFIVGIYGMNFDFMPELTWRYGYPAIMLLMLLLVGGMLYYFRRNNWI
jgi:magnesium transporter